jgi:hypothetical protein
MKEMALASKFTKDMSTFIDMGRNFELIGLGIRDMSSLVEKMAMKSLALGLNSKTITSMVNDNLKMINKYGFKDGVEGLSRMAQKSVEFRMNMASVLTLANKVWEPDKALELVANLQVIGGAFGDLNDPIKLMYMATNDVEGLQKALIGAAQSLVTFNTEQGRFEIAGANLRRLRAMADEMGISYEELSNITIAGAERAQASMDLLGKGFNVNDEDKEFLTNIARMEKGEMVIDIPKSLRASLEMLPDQASIALTDLNESQFVALKAQKELLEKMSPEDVARNQVMALENIQRDMSAVRAYMRVMVGQNAANVIEEALGINGGFVSDLSNAVSKLSLTGLEKADKFLQEAIKQVPEIANISKGLGKDVIEGIKGLDKNLQEKTENKQKGEINQKYKSMENLNDPLKTMKESTQSNIPEHTTHDVNLNFNPTNSSLDQVSRIFFNDPIWQEKYKEGFLYPFSN